MEIRTIRKTDAEAVSRLAGQLGYSSSVEEVENRMTAMEGSANDALFGAFAGGAMTGWIHVFYSYRLESDPICEIGGLVVDEAFRGQGAGRALIAAAIEWMKQKGCNDLRVRSNVKRTDAHLFYQNAGFSLQKEQKVFRLDN